MEDDEAIRRLVVKVPGNDGSLVLEAGEDKAALTRLRLCAMLPP